MNVKRVVRQSMMTALVSCLVATTTMAARNPKYVFLFIGDGMGIAQRMATEVYLKTGGQEGLLINTFPACGVTTTHSATDVITDSAAAATAIASGIKTYNGAIGVDLEMNPVETIAEKAKKAGMKVGIISSGSLDQATPASFYSHQLSREMFHEISVDLATSGVFEGTKKVRSTIARYMMMMHFMTARNAPSVLSAQTTRTFLNMILRPQPPILHSNRIMVKITPKLTKGKKATSGRCAFKYSVTSG